MATVRVTHTLDDLERDMTRVTTTAQAKLVPVVRRNIERGNRLAQGFARESSGPHGLHYFKRMSAEMLGSLEGEFGPHAGGVPVGAGYRHGPPNTDLLKAADIIGPKFADDVSSTVDGFFW